MQSSSPLPSSFRDPAGFLFREKGVLYRQVNKDFADAFLQFESSGASEKFIQKGWLLPYERLQTRITEDAQAAFFLQPQELPFISYPYEWSFDMLRDAALLTLDLAEASIKHNMQLKDASAYNVQWYQGKPIFIDTLSFEPLKEGPWVAYRQFCEHFLAPLLLMHYSKQHLPQLFSAWPDGIPLATAIKLLPRRSRFSIHVYLHIHMQASLAAKNKTSNAGKQQFGKDKLARIFLSLKTLIQSLKPPIGNTEWANYYDEAQQRGEYLGAKQALVRQWLREIENPAPVIDLGANEGAFSQIANSLLLPVIAADIDPECVNRLYLQAKQQKNPLITPIWQDLALPSAGIGVNNKERSPFTERVRGGSVLALALIHHLALQKKMSLAAIRDMFATLSPNLIIEFVPVEDEKANLLWQRIEGLKPTYTQEEFESAFSESYHLHKKSLIQGSGRTLYWFVRK